jgi:hypothetical protein
MDYHVHWIARLGPLVLISESWYYSFYNAFATRSEGQAAALAIDRLRRAVMGEGVAILSGSEYS